ncbi:beta-lactamase-like protein [Halenospora varia]|nr:beta-lactamase-like protein [Halenospora varia]
MTDITPKTPPALSLPPSSSIATVQALDTTLRLYVRSENFLNPVIPGHEIYNCPTMAFLITSQTTGRQIMFDAGGRKDYWNYAPVAYERFKKGVNVKGLRCEKGVDEVLEEAGVELGGLEGVVWSHWHFDHIGDMSKFPNSVKIIVGPGFKEHILPGYPSNPNSTLLETDYKDKELIEISFSSPLKIGKFRAYDYFSDGSLYLLDVPGHAIGHICALVRTTPTTFMLLGADTCHFAGSLRPSQYLPLPSILDPKIEGLDEYFPCPCPCEVFGDCHPGENEEEKRTSSYYTASTAPGSAYIDPAVANQSISSMKEFDASPDVLVCLAHDPALFDVLPLLNQDKENTVNDWKEKGYKEMVRWRFLNELPRGGKPGREPIVFGFWRDGKQVNVEEALRKDV